MYRSDSYTKKLPEFPPVHNAGSDAPDGSYTRYNPQDGTQGQTIDPIRTRFAPQQPSSQNSPALVSPARTGHANPSSIRPIYPSGSFYDPTPGADVAETSSLDDFEFGLSPLPPAKDPVKAPYKNEMGDVYEMTNVRTAPQTPLLDPFKAIYSVEVNHDPTPPTKADENQNAARNYDNNYNYDYNTQRENDDEYNNPGSYNRGINPFDEPKDSIPNLPKRSRYHYTQLPYFTLAMSIIQVIVFIVELARMSKLTGSAFQTKPYFNPMLGPSTYLLINMGARYVPCMHQVIDITDDTSILFPCANSTTSATDVCNLNELCGLSGLSIEGNAWIPAQWYRIFTPIFLHAGFLHIIFNLLLQMTMGSTMEKSIGIIKFAIIYLASGIAGFLLGANFTPDGIASTGASGALFGVVATNIVSFIYCGPKNNNIYGTRHYGLFICIMVGEIVISFVLGLLPGLDNFSHVGGFAVGTLSAIFLLPDPYFIYKGGKFTRPQPNMTGWQKFLSHWDPRPNHPDKILTRFYVWCTVRVVAFGLTLAYFVALSEYFFVDKATPADRCHWCKYINCIPVNGWCDIGEVTIDSSTASAATSTASPTSSATNTPSQTTGSTSGDTSSPSSDVASTTSAASSLPTSIENTGSGNTPRAVLGDSFLQSQNIGLGFYVLIAFVTICFLRKTKYAHKQ